MKMTKFKKFLAEAIFHEPDVDYQFQQVMDDVLRNGQDNCSHTEFKPEIDQFSYTIEPYSNGKFPRRNMQIVDDTLHIFGSEVVDIESDNKYDAAHNPEEVNIIVKYTELKPANFTIKEITELFKIDGVDDFKVTKYTGHGPSFDFEYQGMQARGESDFKKILIYLFEHDRTKEGRSNYYWRSGMVVEKQDIEAAMKRLLKRMTDEA